MRLLNNLTSLVLCSAAVFSPALAQDTIKIGEIASLTGKEASLGTSSHQGTVLAIEEANAGGGLIGKTLELISEDTQSKPGEAGTSVRKLISRDKVVALLGEVASSRSLEAAPICQSSKIPMISPASTNPRVTEIGDYIFRTCFVDPFQGPVVAHFALKTLKVQKVAILSSVSSAYSVGLAKYFKEAFVAGGGTVVLEPKYSEGDKDFKAQITAIKAAGADSIFAPGYYSEGGLIIKQAREFGITAPILAGDSWEAEQLIEIGGKNSEHVYICVHFSPEDPSPRIQNFIAAYKKRWNSVPDSNAALGYDSALVLLDSIKRAGTIEHAKLRDAIAATKDFDAVTGMISINAKRDASKKAEIITVKEGRFQFVESVSP